MDFKFRAVNEQDFLVLVVPQVPKRYKDCYGELWLKYKSLYGN